MLFFPFDAHTILSTKLFPGYMLFTYLSFAKCYSRQETDIIPLNFSTLYTNKNKMREFLTNCFVVLTIIKVKSCAADGNFSKK